MSTTTKSRMAQQKNSSSNYTKPRLRERLKAKVMRGTKGGRAGQWSARKAQLLAHEYEEAGGGYSGRRTEGQQHLKRWTEEKWTTSDGKPAKRGKQMHRYLPEHVWKQLSPGERKATNAKKLRGDKGGKQFVANTKKARATRKAGGKRKVAAG